jgi:mono/diheme cytochrome c family protein
MGRCVLLPAWLVLWLLALAPNPVRAEEPRSQADFFEKTVRPLLADNCFTCHGPEKQKGKLRLDSRAAILAGGESGPAIVPGKPDASRLIKAIHYDDTPNMPPKGKLTAEQITALTRWVEQGAPWPQTTAQVRAPSASSRPFQITPKDRQFWSFQPVAAWPQASLDHFVLARQEAMGLQHVEPADRRALIRRATFDLLGLPPTVEEVEAFLQDDHPDAFARVVDRLLASPHYGERWARHWLDIARYGEDQAHTFQSRLYPQGYRYRDWLIQAFNDDLPYDRFLEEQIAGDLLDEPGHPERLAALGFFALGPVYYGDPKKLDQLDDRVDTLSRGLLGLTVACARCHDHKFDPISQRDYYSLAGIFASTEYVEVPLVPPAEVEEARRMQTEEDKKRKMPLQIPFIHSLQEAAQPVTMQVHLRGNPATLGDEAAHRFLAILGGEGRPFTKGSGRRELAEAIVRKDNPLTARVLVNRIWQHHFGQGLVRTASNFGALGERPTHPELLDHLTTHFLRSGWSIKALHREIMLSATYQQSSRLDAHHRDIDADNKFLWRMNRRRLEVEAWRDAMLAVAHRLDGTVGGPSLDLAAANNRRRTVYAIVSRHELNSLLRLFDFPDPNITSSERTVTTVPLQQLFVLNSEFMVANARALVASLCAGSDNDAERVRQAFLRLYGRPVTEPELQLGLAFLASSEVSGSRLTRWEQYAQVLLSANEFLYVD